MRRCRTGGLGIRPRGALLSWDSREAGWWHVEAGAVIPSARESRGGRPGLGGGVPSPLQMLGACGAALGPASSIWQRCPDLAV